jgi:GT2 family glycosyltransferase
MISFAIGIPTLNRYDLLIPTLEKYLVDFPDTKIYVINNGIQHIKLSHENLQVIFPDKNLGVAASWNLLCDKIFENHTHALILNDDIYLGYGKNVVQEAIETAPDLLITSYCSWSMFIMPKLIFDYVGRFDEEFYPAYYEDSDYMYRMKLKFMIHLPVEALNPEVFRISMTQERDPKLVNESMQVNRERYIEKWGGLPLLEKYRTPFNQ